LLEPGRHIDGVADDKLSVVAQADDGLSAVDAYAQGELTSDLVVESVHGGLHGQAAADPSLGVVVMNLRNAEDDHNGIADEFLDGAAVRFGDLLHMLEVPRHIAAEQFGVGFGSQLSGTDEIGKEHGDPPPLFAHKPNFIAV
jgi:hypothetical protein